MSNYFNHLLLLDRIEVLRLYVCGRTAACIKIPLGTEVGLSPGHIVLYVDLSPPTNGHSPKIFRPMSVVAKLLDCSQLYIVL